MRVILLALMLVPAAAAQVAFPYGELDSEGIRAPPILEPGAPFEFMAEFTYDCERYDFADGLRLTSRSSATLEDGTRVALSDPGQQVIGPCAEGQDYREAMRLRFDGVLPEGESRDVLTIHLEAWVESNEDPYNRGAGDPVNMTHIILVQPSAEEPLPETAMEPQVIDQRAPGPVALIPLAAALLLRRQR